MVIANSDKLVSESQVLCPECGTTCYLGLRGPHTLIANCPPNGIFLIARNGVRDDAGRGFMNCEERLWLIETALSRFLVDPERHDFMALQSSTLACNQILFRFGPQGFWAEVDCREWNCTSCGNRPLDAAALERLAELGFHKLPGAPNPAAMDLPRDPRALAMLGDDAMLRAYGEDADYEVGVHFKRAAVMSDVIQQLSPADR